MARKKKNNKNNKNNNRKETKFQKKEKKYPILTSKIKRWIVSVILFTVSILIFLSFFNLAGRGGRATYGALEFLIGRITVSLPFILFIAGILFLKPQKKRIFTPIFGAITILIIGFAGLLAVLFPGTEISAGGEIGYLISWPFLKLFGKIASGIIFLAIISVPLLIIWEFTPKRKKAEKENKSEIRTGNEKIEGNAIEEENGRERKKIDILSELPKINIKKIKKAAPKEEKTGKSPVIAEKNIGDNYKVPPITYFSESKEKIVSGDIKYSSEVIKKTLETFGIEVEMAGVNIGPTVTQYTLKPAQGIKLSKITSLANDLSLALASHPIRIEAPIPGKSLVGIEVPNKERAIVGIRSLLANPQYQNSNSPLIIPLGKTSAGESVFANIEKMPHLLVAGSTGSGKTIFLQDLIVSLVYRNSPQRLKLLLVDPKRVEFPIYNDLPHLLAPVVFSAAKTLNLLNWLIGEMERRFDVLSEARARDIQTFNKMVEKDAKLKEEYGIMPYIVLVVDELADLMMAKGRDIESGIVRLSQLARAVGIHLVVATQRPSVDVITGLIKANLTSRIAFQVASQVDSRTILDTVGAETLLGKGDMLFLSSDFGKPRRIQGCYIDQKDAKRVVEFIKNENEATEKENIEEALREMEETNNPESSESYQSDDPLYQEAVNIVREYKKASASLLQRRLKIGYARAARLMDMLEDNNMIGPSNGAKPREVYIGGEETHRFNFDSSPGQPLTESDEDNE